MHERRKSDGKAIMTLFRPAVIEAQRRRVFGDVTLHQPARLAAFTIVAVVSVSIGTAFLALGQFALKETVMGWVAPEAGLSAVYAPRGGDWVTRQRR